MKYAVFFCSAVLSLNVFGWGNDYLLSPRDSSDYQSYNSGADSMRLDYDNDGTPNYIDPYDNDWMRDRGSRDYDNDGTSNYLDPYNNNSPFNY